MSTLAVARRCAVLTDAARDRRRLVVGVTATYLVAYLLAARDVVITRGEIGRFADIPSLAVAPDWPAKLLRQTGPFSYEPVLAIYPMEHVQILVSPVNIALGLVLGVLVALNVAAAVHAFRTRTCRSGSLAGIAGALPGFLTGFACCVPTLALVLGAPLTAALVTVRSWLYPLALVALLAGLALSCRRAARPL